MTAAAGLLGIVILGGCQRGIEEEITAPELRSHVEYLASDALEGRYTGTSGVAAAESYIADFFGELGLLPLPDEEDYFLEFELQRRSYDKSATFLVVDGTGYQLGKDFRPFPFSDDGEIEAEVVFVGYGITAPEYDYDDYAGLEVTGKIVLLMRHEPDETGTKPGWFEGERHSRHAYFLTKAKTAAANGAVGMLLYTDPLHHASDSDLRVMPRYGFPNGEIRGRDGRQDPVADGFPAFHISREAASALLPGTDLSDLQRAVDSLEPVSQIVKKLGTGKTVRMKQTDEYSTGTVAARNVAAYLPGTGDGEDWILVGAHHDHIGSYSGEGDTVYNGADDNASGVAGVLELAEQFAAHPAERGIVFITFGAEEIGLFGSYALDRYDLIDFERIGFMLNLDMIGRNPEKPVELYGDGFTDGLEDLVRAADEKHGVEIAFQGRSYEPFSDIAVFHDNRIPFLMFFTGEHPDYHGTGDHAEKLEYDRMAKLLQLSYDVIDSTAGAERLLRFE